MKYSKDEKEQAKQQIDNIIKWFELFCERNGRDNVSQNKN